MIDFSIELEAEIANTMQQIATAAARADLDAVEHLAKKATELKAIQHQNEANKNRFRALRNGQSPTAFVRTPGALRELAVSVTQGMINQHLLTLTEAVKRGQIHPGDKVNIEALPSGDRFQTELLPLGNKFQERSKIGKFYRDAAVRAGDVVLLVELTPSQWQLKKRP